VIWINVKLALQGDYDPFLLVPAIDMQESRAIKKLKVKPRNKIILI